MKTEIIVALLSMLGTHNQFARRMPVLEEKIEVQNHRIKDLEEILK